MRIVASSSLNNEANKIKECINDISRKINEIKSIMGTVHNFWAGDDANSFIKKYQELLIEIEKYNVCLNDYYVYLSKVNGVYDALESSYDDPIDIN